MSSRIKHMQRSHKTYGKNGSVFSGFERNAFSRAYRNESMEKMIPALIKMAYKFKSLFKRQGK